MMKSQNDISLKINQMQNLPCCCLRPTGSPITTNRETDYPTANSVHYTSKVWNQNVVTYAWLNTQNEIEDVVEAWIDWINTNLGIRLQKIDDPKRSDMRFDVKPEDGGRSYYGNDALKISDKSMWTTNFGFEEYDPKLFDSTPDIDKWKIARVAPHEVVGHALGSMLHMQFHSDINYSIYDRTWRKDQGYSLEEIERHYALKKAISENLHESIQFSFRADELSCMLYPIVKKRLAPDSQKFGYEQGNYKINFGWSKGDEMFMKTLFPKSQQNCVDQFTVAQLRKLLLQADNLLK